MASFSLDFPDDEILDLLGDDIKLFNPGGGFIIIKGEFEHKYMEDELGDTVSINYPTITVNDFDANLFRKKYKVEYNNETYTVLSQMPADVGKTLIVLRS